ncbi:MAG: hypothetical protein QXI09_00190 [Candidatus Aenigmatarchaeota archaeon]
MRLSVAEEIVQKLNSGKYGLLTLSKEYGISPKQILSLSKRIDKERKKREIKEKLIIEGKKKIVLGKLNYYITTIKKTLEEYDDCDEFMKYCLVCLNVLEELAVQVKKCSDREELNVIKNLCEQCFRGIKIKYGEVWEISSPEYFESIFD